MSVCSNSQRKTSSELSYHFYTTTSTCLCVFLLNADKPAKKVNWQQMPVDKFAFRFFHVQQNENRTAECSR